MFSYLSLSSYPISGILVFELLAFDSSNFFPEELTWILLTLGLSRPEQSQINKNFLFLLKSCKHNNNNNNHSKQGHILFSMYMTSAFSWIHDIVEIVISFNLLKKTFSECNLMLSLVYVISRLLWSHFLVPFMKDE